MNITGMPRPKGAVDAVVLSGDGLVICDWLQRCLTPSKYARRPVLPVRWNAFVEERSGTP